MAQQRQNSRRNVLVEQEQQEKERDREQGVQPQLEQRQEPHRRLMLQHSQSTVVAERGQPRLLELHGFLLCK